MYPTIHDASGRDLTTHGYGSLADCLSCEITEELNGSYTLEMRYPLQGIRNEYLAVGNIIMVKPNHAQGLQPFRIHQIRRTLNNAITVYANHICYDLSGYPYRPARSYNSLEEVIYAMNNATYDTGNAYYHQFQFATDFTSSTHFAVKGIQTLRSWMGGQEGSIIDTYGGEWEYDGFTCYLKLRRGENTGIRISYGKNLAEYQKEQNNSFYSHICAYYDKNDEVVYSDLTATGAICAFRVLYYDATKNFDSTPTKAQLNAIAATQKPNESQTITVTPAQIGDVIGLGDTVYICYENVFTTRVIKTVWNVLADNYSKLELGTKKAGITDTIKALSGSGTTATPTDYVIQQGTSNGWTYSKWASGKYECWLRDSSKKGTINQSWESFYYGTLTAYTYPITFTDYPVINITVQAANGGAWAVPNYSDYSMSNTGTIYLYRPSQITDMNLTVNIYACGRWK